MPLAFLQSQSAADQVANLNTQMLDYVKVFLILGVLLGLLLYVVRVWLPKWTGRPLGGPQVIEVIARQPLDLKKVLYVVRVGRKYALVSGTESDVRLVCELSPEDVEPALAKSSAAADAGAGKSFADVFRALKKDS